MWRRKSMAAAAAAYKPQAKTVDVQRINPDAAAEYHFSSYNNFHPCSIQDTLPLSTSIYDHQIESDPADFMEVDGHGGDFFTNFSHSSMTDVPMDTLDDLFDAYTSMEIDGDNAPPMPIPQVKPAVFSPPISPHRLHELAECLHMEDDKIPLAPRDFNISPLPETLGSFHDSAQPILLPETGPRHTLSEATSHPALIYLSFTPVLDGLPIRTNIASTTERSAILDMVESKSAPSYNQQTETESAQFRSPSNIEISSIVIKECSGFVPLAFSVGELTAPTSPSREEVAGPTLSPHTSAHSGSSSDFNVPDLYLNELHPFDRMPNTGELVPLSPVIELAQPRNKTTSKGDSFEAYTFSGTGTSSRSAVSPSVGAPRIDADGRPLACLTADCVMKLLQLRYDRITRERNDGQNGLPSPTCSQGNGGPVVTKSLVGVELREVASVAEGEKMGSISSGILDEVETGLPHCDSVVQLIIPTTFGHTQNCKPAPNVLASLSEKGDVMTTSNTPVNSANRASVRLPLSAIDPNIPPQRKMGTPSLVGLALGVKPILYDKSPKRAVEESHIIKFNEITPSPSSPGSNSNNALFSTLRPAMQSQAQVSSPVCLPSTPPPTSQGSLVLPSEEHTVALRPESPQHPCIRFFGVNDTSDPAFSNSTGVLCANEFTGRFHVTEREQHQSKWTFYAAKQWTLGPGTELKVLPCAVPDTKYHDVNVAHPIPVEPNSLSYRILRQLFGW